MNAEIMDGMKTIGDYNFPTKDTEDKFFGNWLIYIAWENHLMFCAPFCLPLPTSLPFGAFVRDVLPQLYGEHTEFEQIDWQRVRWYESKQEFLPDFGKSLQQHGFGHKTLIRFVTPSLEGSRSHIDSKKLAF